MTLLRLERRMACAQSFALLKHAAKEIGGRDHCTIVYSRHLGMCAMLRAHPMVVHRAFNTAKWLQQGQ